METLDDVIRKNKSLNVTLERVTKKLVNSEALLYILNPDNNGDIQLMKNTLIQNIKL